MKDAILGEDNKPPAENVVNQQEATVAAHETANIAGSNLLPNSMHQEHVLLQAGTCDRLLIRQILIVSFAMPPIMINLKELEFLLWAAHLDGGHRPQRVYGRDNKSHSRNKRLC